MSPERFRTAGNNTRSPIACDIAYLSFSKPNDPAIPQQPESMRLQISAHLAEQRIFVVHFHKRFMMAVSVKQDFARELRGTIIREHGAPGIR